MRIVLNVAAAAVISLVALLGLRWFGLISYDAAVVGFVTGLVVAVLISLSNLRKGSTG